MGGGRRAILTWTLAVVALASACAPARPSSESSAPVDDPSATTSRFKLLTVAVQRELKNFARFTGAAAGGGSPGAGNNQVAKIAHAYLALETENTGVFLPHLAYDLPSVEKGTWRVNPDGTMDTVWKLRSGVKWHDGTPFTAEDLVFGSALFRDPDYPVPPTERLRQIQSTSAPDPLTFVVHWATTVASAAEPTDTDPLPRHLLEAIYRADKQAILTTPLLSSEFVGLGPYRLVRWQEGVELEFVRFPDYFMGRPPLDRVLVKYIADPNTMLANVLAGSVDVVLPPSVNLDVAAELSQRWAGTGNQVLNAVTGSQQFLRPQFRPELAQPRDGAPNLNVRRALYVAIDRRLVADASTNGLAPIADSWVPPTDPRRPLLEAAIPQYPYDVARALRLLGEEGWMRGADDVLVRQATGERFESKVSARPTAAADKTLAVMADGWKAIGVQMHIEVLPPALAADRRTMGSQPFAIMSSYPAALNNLPPMHTSLLASDANRWSGTNFQGYSNPRADAIMNRLLVTIEEAEQLTLHRQLLQEALGDVALMPLFWEVNPVLIVRGVTGVTYNGTSNIFQWARE